MCSPLIFPWRPKSSRVQLFCQPFLWVSRTHGRHTTKTKLFEAQNALENGAREIDMVLNLIKLHSHEDVYVRDEIHAVVELVHQAGILVKVITSNSYLTKEEIV